MRLLILDSMFRRVGIPPTQIQVFLCAAVKPFVLLKAHMELRLQDFQNQI